MKKTLLLALFSFSMVTVTTPSFASTEGETCLNEILHEKFADIQFDGAKRLAQVEHKGITYHWLQLQRSSGRYKTADAVIATNSQGFCNLSLFDAPGNLSSPEDYYQYLGKEVTDKFTQSFREKR
ncbi:hypothetical protein ACSYAD_33895 [Acaryochloris marina NIES-2412]|uniref:hypothetical protein n=1 Tax=Acaryochloris marina TaxID=155978 RepID=UPI004059221A